jgi:hypothetical protein
VQQIEQKMLNLQDELNKFLTRKINIFNGNDVIQLQETYGVQILPVEGRSTFCSLVFPTRPKVESFSYVIGTVECILLGYQQNPEFK